MTHFTDKDTFETYRPVEGEEGQPEQIEATQIYKWLTQLSRERQAMAEAARDNSDQIAQVSHQIRTVTDALRSMQYRNYEPVSGEVKEGRWFHVVSDPYVPYRAELVIDGGLHGATFSKLSWVWKGFKGKQETLPAHKLTADRLDFADDFRESLETIYENTLEHEREIKLPSNRKMPLLFEVCIPEDTYSYLLFEFKVEISVAGSEGVPQTFRFWCY